MRQPTEGHGQSGDGKGGENREGKSEERVACEIHMGRELKRKEGRCRV